MFSLFLLLSFVFPGFSKTRPNILFLIPDEWRSDFADDYYINSLPLNTPVFSSLVSQGTRFVNTLVASPLCAPSRSCIASGREYDYAGVPSNEYDYPNNTYTMYSLMRDNGYHVMVSGKDDLTKPTGCGLYGDYRAQELGWSDWARSKGKMDCIAYFPNITDPYASYLRDNHLWTDHNDCIKSGGYCCPNSGHACPYVERLCPPKSYGDNYVKTKTIELFQRRPKNTPWFIQVNFPGPHPPFAIIEWMNLTVNNLNNSLIPYPYNCSENYDEMMTARKDYIAEIQNIDNLFGEIITYLKYNTSDYNNTIICISSDHGELLGDYDNWGKSKPWYSSTNVPLVCAGPKIKQNHIIKTRVTNMDLMATFLELSNTKIDSKLNITSISLIPFLNGTWTDNSNNYRDYISSGLNNWRLVQKTYNGTSYRYVCCDGQCPGRSYYKPTNNYTQLLYNMDSDLYMLDNIAQGNENLMKEMNKYLPNGFCNVY